MATPATPAVGYPSVEVKTPTGLIANPGAFDMIVVDAPMVCAENEVIVSDYGVTVLRTALSVCLEYLAPTIHCSSVLLL